jgi:hypothetical protein
MKAIMVLLLSFLGADLLAAEDAAFEKSQKALNAFIAAKCQTLDPIITQNLGGNLYEAYADEDTPLGDWKSIPEGTIFLVKTNTFRFTNAGQSDSIALELKGKKTIPRKNGFKEELFLFEETNRCTKLGKEMAEAFSKVDFFGTKK